MKIALTIQIGTFERWSLLENIVDNFISAHEVDIYIATDETHVDFFLSKYPTAVVLATPNLGTDIGKFLYTLKAIHFLNKDYDYILKVHTKKPSFWTFKLLEILDPLKFSEILETFTDPEVGMVGISPYMFLEGNYFYDRNDKILQHIFQKYHIDFDQYRGYVDLDHTVDINFISEMEMMTTCKSFDHVENLFHHNTVNLCLAPNIQVSNSADCLKFIAGTIFVVRYSVFKEFLIPETIEYFLDQMKIRKEVGYFTDYPTPRITHALERLFGFFVKMAGKKVVQI